MGSSVMFATADGESARYAPAMTKSELIAVVSDRFPQLLRVDAEMAVNEILGAIAETLASGGRVEIRGFGVDAR